MRTQRHPLPGPRCSVPPFPCAGKQRAAGFPRACVASIVAVAAILLSACGDTFDTGTLAPPKQTGTIGDTVYVLQQPVWSGFAQPADVLVGYEPFVYVADRGNDRIVMLDLSGTVVGASRAIPRPTAIAQDHRLRLIVCAEFDTLIDKRTVTFGAIYAIDLRESGHDIGKASIRRIHVDPLAPQRRYTGVAVLSDNSYYITRTGPSNGSPIDPDDAILLFSKTDVLQPRSSWPTLGVDGTGLASLSRPTSITTLPKPSTDFLFTQQGERSLFRAQWITLRSSGDLTQWESYFSPSREGDADFVRVGVFARPEDVTVDADGTIFVVDAAKDSVYAFTRGGFLLRAFGGAPALSAPEGIAVFNRTLYIADTGNNRVLRYVLSSDLK